MSFFETKISHSILPPVEARGKGVKLEAAVLNDHIWCDQTKSVWSRLDSNFFNLPDCVHHFKNYILQKILLKLDIWFQT